MKKLKGGSKKAPSPSVLQNRVNRRCLRMHALEIGSHNDRFGYCRMDQQTERARGSIYIFLTVKHSCIIGQQVKFIISSLCNHRVSS